MPTPNSCLQIFEAIGPFGAIGNVAAINCRILLEANWRVGVVAQQLDAELQKEVEWLQLHVPAKSLAYKWLTARKFMQQAIGDSQWDVMQTHQPQYCDRSDIFQCHFLTRAAAVRGILPAWNARQAKTRVQEEIVLRAEDKLFKRLAAMDGPLAPHILFDSELTRNEFCLHYGTPKNPDVLVYAIPPARFPSPEERQAARQRWASEAGNKLVVGFLGGLMERKGYRRVLAAMQDSPDLFLLFGGPHCENFKAPELGERFKNVEYVSDVNSFYAACDAFVVASDFEPLGMVALEAAAAGVPVIAGEGVGAALTLQKYGCGTIWPQNARLQELVQDAVARRETMNLGAQKMCHDLSAQAYGKRLLEVCEGILEKKARSQCES